jgi:UPF0755 protein
MARYHHLYGNVSARKKKVRNRKIFLFTLLFLFILLVIGLMTVYQIILKPNVWTADGERVEIIIPTGTVYEDVKQTLYSKGVIVNRNTFEMVSKALQYTEKVKPGRYLIDASMNNLELVRLLRSGKQSPVQLTFNNMRDVVQLAGRVSTQIELDSASLIERLSDTAYLRFLGFNLQTIPALFIPNTYEFYWTTNAENFVSRMYQEYKRFWNDDRLAKATAIGFTPVEVSTLAAIVDKETNMNDEKQRIAGVYINRLRGGWRLQADPTLVFAAGDFEIRRVLDIHKSIESPYNTYKYTGLPPGPICIPSIASIDAVLNFEKHRFYFFCAKDDLSGYHAFAETYDQHQMNAWRYRQALDRLNIKR